MVDKEKIINPLEVLQKIAGDDMRVEMDNTSEESPEDEPVLFVEDEGGTSQGVANDSAEAPADHVEPAAEEEGDEAPASLGDALAQGIREADEQLKKKEAAAIAPPQKERQTKKERQQLTEAMSKAFVDSDISREELRTLLAEVSNVGAIKYAVDKQFQNNEAYQQYLNMMIEIIFKHREANPDAVGYGIGKVLKALERTPGVKKADLHELKGILYAELFMREFLKRYLDLKKAKGAAEDEGEDALAMAADEEPPEEPVAQPAGSAREDDTAGEEPEVADLSPAELADQLADRLKEEPEEPSTPEPDLLKVTDEDIAKAAESRVVMAPDTDDKELEVDVREPVTYKQFQQLLANSRFDRQIFYSRFVRTQEQFISGLLAQYSAQEISAEDLQRQIIDKALELNAAGSPSIYTKAGSSEISAELVQQFFDELLGSAEAGQEDSVDEPEASVPVSGSGGRALASILSRVVKNIPGLRNQTEAERLAKMLSTKDKPVSVEEAQQMLDKKNKNKPDGESVSEEVPESVGAEEILSADDPDSPVKGWQPLDSGDGVELSSEAEPEGDSERVEEAESEDEPAENTAVKAEKPVEIPPAIRSRVSELLGKKEYEQLRQFFFDEMTKAVGTDAYEPLNKAFQAVAKFLK